MNYDIEVLVIGAGVAGLAIGECLLESGIETAIVEKNRLYGLETSSRNSEVIHSGIHYPAGSLKAVLSVEGNRLLYALCARNNILHRRTGKITVAASENETAEIEQLFRQGTANGVPGFEMWDRKKIREMEPEVNGFCALFSPYTGIVDVHGLMDYFAGRIKQKSGFMVFGSKVTAVDFSGDAYKVSVKSKEGVEKYTSRIVINSAGLFSDEIARICGIDIDGYNYRLHWCKGDYFSYRGRLNANRLVYPVPATTGLGIHLTHKLDGTYHFGPDTEYVGKKANPYPSEDARSDFTVDDSKKELFYDDIKTYLPAVKKEFLEPEMYGIRAKLQGPDDPFRDFIIKEESDKGLPGMINLIGIDSPGLTSCLAIGKRVAAIVKQIL